MLGLVPEEEEPLNNRVIVKNHFIFLLLLVNPVFCMAQFAGGLGSGIAFTRTIQVTLDGNSVNTKPLYLGGESDGASNEKMELTVSGMKLSALFNGGFSDGVSFEKKGLTLSGSELSTLYRGGSNDGFDRVKNVFVVNGSLISTLYRGGDDDGIGFQSFQGLLNRKSLSILYSGGSGDGNSRKIYSTTPSGVNLAMLYEGSGGDGHARNDKQATLNGEELAMLYGGGEGDGHVKGRNEFIIHNLKCTMVVNTNDNGPGSLRNAISCAVSGSTVEFSPALAQDTIMLSSEQLTISKDLTINGSTIADLYLDARQVERAIKLNANTLSITGLNIIIGSDPNNGAIENGGTLVLENLTIIDPNGNTISVIEMMTGANLNIKGEVQIKSQ